MIRTPVAWHTFISICLLIILFAHPNCLYGFDSFEHRYIGDRAWERAKDTSQLKKETADDLDKALIALLEQAATATQSTSAPSQYFHMNLPLSFGDLAAFGGDFTETPEDLLKLLFTVKHGNDPRFVATRRQWMSACSWLSAIKSGQAGKLDSCFRDLLAAEDISIEEDIKASSFTPIRDIPPQGYEPSRGELAEFERLKDYSSIAANNRMHFSPYSWKEYAKYHENALQIAKRYARCETEPVCIDNEKKESLKKAILHEGFAQHFLHDSLSAGHIGSTYGYCVPLFVLPLLCQPTKDYLQHTHDELNRIGLRVEVFMPVTPEASLHQFLLSGWTAFGDRHLLTSQATFHRHVVVGYATASLKELFSAINGDLVVCSLCQIGNFPVWQEEAERYKKELSDGFLEKALSRASLLSLFAMDFSHEPDQRVTPLSLEGWKFQVGYGRLAKIQPPSSLTQGGTVETAISATTYEIGYVRSGSSSLLIPNYVGAGVLYSPLVISVYPVSIGWWGNPFRWMLSLGNFQFLDGYPVIFGARINAGFQTAEPSTRFNPNPTRSVQFELSGVLDMRIQIYGPFGFYIRSEVARATVSDWNWQFGSGLNGGVLSTIFGMSYDLAGVL